MKDFKSVDEFISLVGDDCFGLSIGNFDGVHIGHRQFITNFVSDCKKSNLRSVLMTFVPHPHQILDPKPNFLLNTYSERKELLSSLGIEFLIEINFTRDFSTLGPKAFLDRYVFNVNTIKKLYLGHDFAFGANKTGDFQFVKSYCDNIGVSVTLENEFKQKNQNVSSTKIRNLLMSGNIKSANSLLGREFFVKGRIIRGAGRGKKIGFPTANIEYSFDRIIPKKGVYISTTQYNDLLYHSVTNIGHNPTFVEDTKLWMETFILDFDNDIYGEEIKVALVDYIREEKKFSSVNDLVGQIGKDVNLVKKYFKL